MAERLVGGLPVELVEKVRALNERVQERTTAFSGRGFWTRVWEAISGQHHRGLLVFAENQVDIMRTLADSVSELNSFTGADTAKLNPEGDGK